MLNEGIGVMKEGQKMRGTGGREKRLRVFWVSMKEEREWLQVYR